MAFIQGNVTSLVAEMTGAYTSVNKFGTNTDVDTTTEDIWSGGGTWAAPVGAKIHDIVSSSASDTAAGTGARTIEIFGLTSWDTPEESEEITMNGITDVATTKSYVIIHRMKVLTTGSAGPNVGAITATSRTPATVTARIEIGKGQTEMAIYGVPSTQTAYMSHFYASISRAQAATVDIVLLYNPDPGNFTGYLTKHTGSVNSSGTNNFQHYYTPYKSFEGPGIIKMEGTSSANNADISAGFDLILL